MPSDSMLPSRSYVGSRRGAEAQRIEVAGDVSVVVVERNIELVSGGVRSGGVADSEVEKPADAPCALQRSRNVFAPTVADRRGCAVRVGDALLDQIPAVVEERRHRLWRDLPDAARLGVIEVRDVRDTV